MIAAILPWLTPRRVALLAVGLLVLGLAADDTLQRSRVSALRLEIAKSEAAAAHALADASQKARAQETEHQRRLSEIDQQHQEDMDRANQDIADLDRRIADASVRLRKQAACLRVPSPPAAASGSDEAAQSGESLASAVVRVGAETDAQLRACQAVIRADRKSTEKK